MIKFKYIEVCPRHFICHLILTDNVQNLYDPCSLEANKERLKNLLRTTDKKCKGWKIKVLKLSRTLWGPSMFPLISRKIFSLLGLPRVQSIMTREMENAGTKESSQASNNNLNNRSTRLLVPPDRDISKKKKKNLRILQKLRHPLVEDVNYMLTTSTKTPDWLEPKGGWLRFSKHHPVTSPPRRKPTSRLCTLQLSPLKLPLKTLPWKPSGSLCFEHGLPILLSWPCNKHCAFLYHNLVSVDWLCCTLGEQTWNQLGNRTSPTLHPAQSFKWIRLSAQVS